MSSKKVNFKSSGGVNLSGIIDFPTHTKAHNFVLFAHCFTCNKNLNSVRHISRALNKNGFAVLRFDFTGLGQSEGDFAETNFTSNVMDLVQAANYLSDHYQPATLLVGHSLGGAAVLAAAEKIDSVTAVATIGAPFTAEHIKHLFADDDAEQQLNDSGKAHVNIGGRNFTIGKTLVDDITKHDPEHAIATLNRALLIMHSPQDAIVEIDNASAIYLKAKHPKSFVSLDGADHLLSNPNDADYAGNTIANWANRYLQLPEEVELSTDQEVVVRLESDNGYETNIKAGKHYLIADEPPSVGGSDYGPTPYGYLTTALGSCTAMTMLMYARRKKWPLDAVTVHLTHAKVHAKDIDTDLQGDKRGRLDKIDRHLEIEGELSDEQQQRLVEIADLCPVHKTLESQVYVTTKLRNT